MSSLYCPLCKLSELYEIDFKKRLVFRSVDGIDMKWPFGVDNDLSITFYRGGLCYLNWCSISRLLELLWNPLKVSCASVKFESLVRANPPTPRMISPWSRSICNITMHCIWQLCNHPRLNSGAFGISDWITSVSLLIIFWSHSIINGLFRIKLIIWWVFHKNTTAI